MYLIRESRFDDVDMFFKLAKTSHFVNLPPAKDIIEEKIQRSRESFEALGGKSARSVKRTKDAFTGPLFMFSIEDNETGNCLGTSMVIARMGGEGHPNCAFRLEPREFFSQELRMGSRTQALVLDLDESGPTEIGGLIVSPAVRRHPARIGKQLSLMRFHFIGLYRKAFANRLIAEMMAPIGPQGDSPFWEYLGRRFINLTYEEAYRFSQRSRDFMFELLPRDPIYLSLLPPEARRVIGAVGKDTVPAVKLLESMGFRLNGKVDPFDGGPHLDAKTDDVEMIRSAKLAKFAGTVAKSKAKRMGFVSLLTDDGEYRALHTAFAMSSDGAEVSLPKDSAKAMGVEEGHSVGVTTVKL